MYKYCLVTKDGSGHNIQTELSPDKLANVMLFGSGLFKADYQCTPPTHFVGRIDEIAYFTYTEEEDSDR